MAKRKQFDPAALDAFVDEIDIRTETAGRLLEAVRGEFEHVPTHEQVATVARYVAVLADLSVALFGKLSAAHDRSELERKLREEMERQREAATAPASKPVTRDQERRGYRARHLL